MVPIIALCQNLRKLLYSVINDCFKGEMNPMSNVVLIAACLLLSTYFILQERQEHYVSAVILKGLASMCFVILGFSLSDHSRTANMITTGLLLGMIADILLNLRFVLKSASKPVFLAGILVFLSGHILYLLAVFPDCPSKLPCIIASVVLTALLMAWIFTKITAEKAFKLFGIVYIGAIVLLNCTAYINLFAAPSLFRAIFAAGALLFLVSDIVLILNTFGSEQKFSLRVTNLSLYYAGQLFIAISLLALQMK